MLSDYEKWYDQNKDLLQALFNHNSLVFDNIYDVLKVTEHIKKLETKARDADLDLIFDEGFAYLYNKVNEIKLYLEHHFNNDLHHFLHFELIINYCFYLDDLKETLEDKESYSDYIKEGFNQIYNEIENIINTKSDFSDDIIDHFNNTLLCVIPSNKEFLTIPEIFSRICEELQID